MTRNQERVIALLLLGFVAGLLYCAYLFETGGVGKGAGKQSKTATIVELLRLSIERRISEDPVIWKSIIPQQGVQNIGKLMTTLSFDQEGKDAGLFYLMKSNRFVDAWGNELRVEITCETNSNELTVVVRSSGVNGVFDDRDDLISRSPVRTLRDQP